MIRLKQIRWPYVGLTAGFTINSLDFIFPKMSTQLATLGGNLVVASVFFMGQQRKDARKKEGGS